MKNRNAWDRISGLYDFVMKKDEKAFEKIGRLIKKDRDRDLKVLELGAGTGNLTENIQPFFRDYTATDYSEKMVEHIKKKSIKDVKAERADGTDLQFEDGNFDIVIIANTLHIVPEPEKILNEIKRVLKPDGILIAPNFISSAKFKEKIFKRVMKTFGVGVKHPWSYDQYLNFLSENGFKILKDQPVKASFTIAYTESGRVDI